MYVYIYIYIYICMIDNYIYIYIYMYTHMCRRPQPRKSAGGMLGNCQECRRDFAPRGLLAPRHGVPWAGVFACMALRTGAPPPLTW